MVVYLQFGDDEQLGGVAADVFNAGALLAVLGGGHLCVLGGQQAFVGGVGGQTAVDVGSLGPVAAVVGGVVPAGEGGSCVPSVVQLFDEVRSGVLVSEAPAFYYGFHLLGSRILLPLDFAGSYAGVIAITIQTASSSLLLHVYAGKYSFYVYGDGVFCSGLAAFSDVGGNVYGVYLSVVVHVYGIGHYEVAFGIRSAARDGGGIVVGSCAQLAQ